MQFLEQVFCALVGIVFLYWSLRFFNRKEQEGKAFILLCLSAGFFFCTLSSVQTFIKTGILWKVDTKLTEYMEKIDGFQTNVTAMRDDLSKQQTLLKSNQVTMEGQITNFQSEISSTRKEITNQLASIQSLENDVSAQEKRINFVDGEVRSNQTVLSTRQMDAENDIRGFQEQMAQARQEITNQLQSVQDIGGKLSIAETNLESQQKQIGSVESLVRDMYSRAKSETFALSDSSRVVVQYLKPNTTRILFRLKDPAVENSVEGIVRGAFGMGSSLKPYQVPGLLVRGIFNIVGVSGDADYASIVPLVRLGSTNNVAIAYFICKPSVIGKGATFELQYVKDVSVTNAFKKVEQVTNNIVLFDGKPWLEDPAKTFLIKDGGNGKAIIAPAPLPDPNHAH